MKDADLEKRKGLSGFYDTISSCVPRCHAGLLQAFRLFRLCVGALLQMSGVVRDYPSAPPIHKSRVPNLTRKSIITIRSAIPKMEGVFLHISCFMQSNLIS